MRVRNHPNVSRTLLRSVMFEVNRFSTDVTIKRRYTAFVIIKADRLERQNVDDENLARAKLRITTVAGCFAGLTRGWRKSGACRREQRRGTHVYMHCIAKTLLTELHLAILVPLSRLSLSLFLFSLLQVCQQPSSPLMRFSLSTPNLRFSLSLSLCSCPFPSSRRVLVHTTKTTKTTKTTTSTLRQLRCSGQQWWGWKTNGAGFRDLERHP